MWVTCRRAGVLAASGVVFVTMRSGMITRGTVMVRVMIPVLSRASNEGSLRCHNHREGLLTFKTL